jgi:hypothetical protein
VFGGLNFFLLSDLMSQSKQGKQASQALVSSSTPAAASTTVRRGLGRGGSIGPRFQAPESLTKQIEEAAHSVEQINQAIVRIDPYI